jgi:hypothetical protein
MRKQIILALGMLMILSAVYSQSSVTYPENFDGNTINFVSSPALGWKIDSNYYASANKSIRGVVPNMPGDSIVLTSPVYDFSDYDGVSLRFKHICKISPSDVARIEYRISGQNWAPIQASTYMGSSKMYTNSNTLFNTNAYLEWMLGDSLTLPEQSWWKDEIFDLSFETGGESGVQFRFILRHGNTAGTQISYGWLIDDIEITATEFDVKIPIVSFIAPLYQDTLYHSGPFEINAKVKSQTIMSIMTPWLKYRVMRYGTFITEDSVLMTKVRGDSLWKATIPAFAIGADVTYSITGIDNYGNYNFATLSYVIARAGSGYVTIGNNTTSELYLPLSFPDNYSWSRQLYLGTEFAAGAPGCVISKLAWNIPRSSALSGWQFSNQSCFFQVVDDASISSVAYVDPGVGADLVWQGSIGMAANLTGWIEITLNQPFVLPPGKNLLVYWNHQAGQSSSYVLGFGSTINTFISAAYGYSDNSFSMATTTLGTLSNRRADARFYVDRTYIPNSASVFSGMEDTVLASPSNNVPIIVGIKNMGILDMNSVQVSYSLNGATPIVKNLSLNPPLLPGEGITDTLGYYNPKIEGIDTIKMEVNLPNGQTDTETSDDVITKYIYGITDIHVEFVKFPLNILSVREPVEVTANIQVRSVSPLGQVSLFIVETLEGTITYDTLPMTNLEGDLWTVTIPEKSYDAVIDYSIQLTDILGNFIVATKSYYINKIVCTSNIGDYIVIQEELAPSYTGSYPFVLTYGYSRSMSLYTAAEIDDKAVGLINKIGLRLSTAANGAIPIKIWLKTVPASKIEWATTDVSSATWDTRTQDATLVYDADFLFGSTGWVDIPLTTPFLYEDTGNLVVMFELNCGGTNQSCSALGYLTTNPAFYRSNTATNKLAYNSSGTLPTSFTLTRSASRPDLRIERLPYCPDSNSVELVSIESPQPGGITAGTPVPIEVVIRNRGDYPLDSCLVNWTLNGDTQSAYIYYGNLAKDVNDTLILSNYTPIEGQKDTITVWVSMPNGVEDNLTTDDKLEVIFMGCPTSLSGSKTVGVGGNFPSLGNAIDAIRLCEMTGDLTLQLKGTFVENVNMQNLEEAMNGYHLTITSLDNHPDSAVIKPTTGTAIVLGKIKNLTFKAITVDISTLTSGTAYGIQSLDTCANILIRDCKLKASITATASTLAPIYRASGTGIADSVFIINNFIEGGYYGIYFYGGPSAANSGTNIVIDSNEITNYYQYGVQSQNTDYKSVSYNSIKSRATSTVPSAWHGLYLSACRASFIVGNRIIQRLTATTPVGMYLTGFDSTVDTALIANNEIILIASGVSNGISTNNVRMRILHNSIYVSGNGAARGIYIVPNATTNYMEIINNNIMMQSSTAYSIYFNATGTGFLSRFITDYNNLYTQNNANTVYYGSAQSLSTWKVMFAKDIHSVTLNPALVNSVSPIDSLQLTDYSGLACPKEPWVDFDIDNNIMMPVAVNMGCYQGMPPVQVSATLQEITNNNIGLISGTTDTVWVTLQNTGLTTLSKCTLKWTWNNQAQPNTVTWAGSLISNERVLIPLEVTYTPAGTYTVKAWIDNLDQLTDANHTDDTVSVMGYICSGGLSGVYTAGKNNADFPSITDFIQTATLCGMAGDVTLELQSDIYEDAIDLTNSNLFTGNYKLTITSTTHNKNDVTIKSPPNKSGVILSQSNNIYLKDITIDATQGIFAAIRFLGSCTNIVIDHCNILATSIIANDSTSGIYKPAAAGDLDSLVISNCTITGGYNAIFLCGRSAMYPTTNVWIENNTISEQYRCGVNVTYYLSNYNISGNRISPASGTGTGTTWYGLYLYYTSGGKVIGNRISSTNTAITTTLYGLWLNGVKHTQIVNNEIYLDGKAATTGGLYVTAPRSVKVINNTVYTIKDGTTGTTNRAYETSIAADDYSSTVKNNIFTASGGAVGTTVAFYLTGTAAIFNDYKALSDIDNNAYYSTGTNIGYVAGALRTNESNLSVWKTAIAPLDQHSVNLLPTFANLALDLQLSNYTGFETSIEPLAVVDIDNNIRAGDITAMGCYHGFSYSVNATLKELSENREALAAGITDSVKIVFANTGSTTLTKATIKWEWNNASQTNFVWIGTLSAGNTVAIPLGKIPANVSGKYTVKAWIDNLDVLTDDATVDDTVFLSGYICSAPLSGTYTVGNTGVFSSVADFIDNVALCGADGDITLEIQSGTYYQSLDLSNISVLMRNNKLTITSAAKDANAVTFISDRIGISLHNSNNIVIKAITVDATAGMFAIKFFNGCTNVVIRDCRLLVDTTVVASSTGTYDVKAAPIIKVTITANDVTGISDSIFIINNLLDGGVTGWHFYGGIGTGAGQYGNNIVFDSNLVTNQSNAGIYFQQGHLTSCSYNTFLSRTGNTSTTWYGVRLYYATGPVKNNRIIQRSTVITTPYGIWSGYISSATNGTSKEPALIANNEVILNATAGTSSGIQTNYARVRIVNNSIYVAGTAASRGIDFANSTSTSYSADVYNNNIVMESNTAYPLYTTTTVAAYYRLGYNNMYAPQYIGYAATAVTTMQQWQPIFPTDLHSVKIQPHFVDSTVNLELSDYTSLICPLYYESTKNYYEVDKDIRGYVRTSMTTMGAYNGLRPSLDLGIQRITNTDETVVLPQMIPVEIVIENLGSSSNVDSATFGWSVNGIKHPSFTWTPSTSLAVEANTTITIGSFSPGGTTAFDITVWIENVNGRKDSIVWNDTAKSTIHLTSTNENLGIASILPLVADGILCIDDSTSLKVVLGNTSLSSDYDFALTPVRMHLQLTQPDSLSLDTLISSGLLQANAEMTIELTDRFPIVTAGQYDIKVWIESINPVVHDDTLTMDYVLGKFGLPVDEDFSNGMPLVFVSSGTTHNKWVVVPEEAEIQPLFGDSMLSFKGSPGSMTTLMTQQLDLSRTVQPSLSFWYFHDTIHSEDYTDVRFTLDGGMTYETLFSLTKYNAEYGWKQYNKNLPLHAVNQCVILVFEAMEKSRSGNVTQYIDRILITARQDIAATEVLTSPLSACDLENREIKIVIKNLSDPALNYVTTPITLTLEVKESGQTYIYDTLLSSGSLGSFASDTITVATGFDFIKGTYNFKAYFSSVLDVDRNNDTLESSIVIDPALSVQVERISDGNVNCLSGDNVIYPKVTLYNTGNMDLSNIELIIQIDTGENNLAPYVSFTETYNNTILAGDSATYIFTNSYSVPWNIRYYVRVTGNLACDSLLAHSTVMVTECVDIRDLRLISIDNPSTGKDTIGNAMQVMATLGNYDDMYDFRNAGITFVVTNSQRIETETTTETIPIVDHLLSATSYTFSNTYTVPNDSVYYLTVYVNSYDNYSSNDSITIKRETVGADSSDIPPAVKGIDGTNGFTLAQNIPNPAKNTTRIDYTIPESGEVIFHVQSVSGQLLYSKTIEAASGKNSLEVNTNVLAAGIYIYSIEYKGQRLIKRMSVQK